MEHPLPLDFDMVVKWVVNEIAHLNSNEYLYSAFLIKVFW